jgi:hypothetical protein
MPSATISKLCSALIPSTTHQYMSVSLRFAPQLIRDDAPLQGRLVIKTSEDPARWLLTFNEESWKDEEFSEEAFGSVLGKSDEGEGSPTDPHPPAPVSAAKNNKSKNNRNRNKPSEESKSGGTSGGSSAEEQSINSDSLQKKAVSFSHEVNPTDTDASLPKQETAANKKRSLRSRVSDREQRSRRRQALIVDEPEVLGSSSTDCKRPRPLESVTRVTKKSKSGVNEEVIKIPMLTGTLFLYRGLRRRAEFIRKY